MNTKYPLIMNIHTMKDIEILKQSKGTEYINIDICHVDNNVIDYFIENGSKYSYSDNCSGYIYVDYQTFCSGEKIINDILLDIPDNLSDLEKSKHLYIQLGKYLRYDINLLPEKNDNFNFNDINTINNIWGSLTNKAATNISYVKTYNYLCSIVNIDCSIIETSNYKYKQNKLEIENNGQRNIIICDLTKDAPYIQGNFQTRYFGNYNTELDMDKKIKYIKNTYSEIELDKSLQKLDYNSNNILYSLLLKTQNIINIKNMGAIELGIIYDMILKKYLPYNHITINNLYANNIYNKKEHFVLISDTEHHYCYNYKKETFSEINNNDLEKNIKDKKVGIYLKEIVPNIKIIEE